MKVALAVNSFPVTSETFIYNHAAGLQAAGTDVTVIAARRSPDEAIFTDPGRLRFTGPIRYVALQRQSLDTIREALPHVTKRSKRGRDLWARSRAMYSDLRRALRAWLLAVAFDGFDIVHIEYSALAVSWLDALDLLRPSKIVVSCRGAAEQITPLMEPKRVDRLRELFQRVDRVHCVSDDMRNTCVGYGLDPARAFINRPAIDAQHFVRTRPYHVRTSGPFVLMSTGRLHWKKGLEYGLLAVRRLIDRGYDVRYEIVGSGLDEERLRFAVADLRLSDHVLFLGKQPSNVVRDRLEAADVYLLPSVSEGLSNAALEAMAMELPIVSTTAGGMNEAITDRRDGRLVATRDSESLASAVSELLDDPNGRVTMGRAARARIESAFTTQRQIDVFVTEYEALLRGASSS